MKISLNKLPIGTSGKIEELNVNSLLKRRLLDLGLTKNTTIKPLYRSPFNDPTAYLIKGSIIALRSDDTKNIIISTEDDDYGSN